jgi:ribosomal protein S21
MAVEIKKQSGDSPQSLVRRFTQTVQKSGILLRVRQNRFKSRPKSRQLKKRAALRREELKKEYEMKRKLGK